MQGRSSRISTLLLGCTLVLLLATSAKADDTDIYIANGRSAGDAPLVMLTLDLKSSVLASNICSTLRDCPAAGYFRSKGLTLPSDDKLYYFDLLSLSLQYVLSQTSGVRVGLMVSHDNKSTANCGFPADASMSQPAQANRTHCSNGGYVLVGFTELTAENRAAASSTFRNRLDALRSIAVNTNPQLNHPYQGKELFFEFFRYLTGQGIYNGHAGWQDYNTDDGTNLNDTGDSQSLAWDAAIEKSGNSAYQSPLTDANGCTSVFTINFSFQNSAQEDESDAAITAAKDQGGMAGINLSGTNNKFSTVISYLYNTDLGDGSFGDVPRISTADHKINVKSYFITKGPLTTNDKTNDYARAGHSFPAIEVRDDPDDLVRALTDIFSQILSTSTTFVASSIPVNVFNRAEIVNNVFIALFQADRDNRPYWPGNVKKLRMAQTSLSDGSKDSFLVDANGRPAVESTTGRLKKDAVTYWTDVDSLPPLTASEQAEGFATDTADGRAVGRGGAGQKIPGFLAGGTTPQLVNDTNAAAGGRTLYFDDDGSFADLDVGDATVQASTCPAVIDSLKPLFDSSTSVQAALSCAALNTQQPLANGSGSSTLAAQIDQLLRYMRGQDVDDLDGDCGADATATDACRIEARSWILGDSLHSRPLPINYGASAGYSTTNPRIYVAVGGNDGYLHLLRNTNADGTESGQESWAFMPQAAMAIQQKLRRNAVTSPPHPYALDGSPAVYIEDADRDGTVETGDHVYLYTGMGRGGRGYYALDITDPEAPNLLWTISSQTEGFSELGHTTSNPRIGFVDNGRGGRRPVVIFAGGYDTNKDVQATGTPDRMGRGIFVVDARDGTLVWKAVFGPSTRSMSGTEYHRSDMLDSIPSDVTIVDTGGTGRTNRIVVGDTGGRVWRADLVGPASNWKVTLLANLGRAGNPANGKTDDRRFFHRPDFVQSRDNNAAHPDFDAVIIGSGDRQDPLDHGGTAHNYMFMIKDRETSSSVPRNADLDLHLEDLTDITTTTCLIRGNCSSPPDLVNGWRLELPAISHREKSLSTAITIAGTIYFTTYLPPAVQGNDTVCGPREGGGRLYSVNLLTGQAVKNNNTSDDVAGDTTGLANSAEDRWDELDSAGIPSEPVYGGKDCLLRPDLKCEKPLMSTRFRTFWYQSEGPR